MHSADDIQIMIQLQLRLIEHSLAYEHVLKYGWVVSGSGYVRILPKDSRALRCERPYTCVGDGSAVAATFESIVS